MTRRHLLALLAAVPFATRAMAPAAMAQDAAEPTQPQPKLPEEKLTIVTRDGVRHDFLVEVATSPEQQEIGLMFRPTVAPDGGMLFDWGVMRHAQMWMKNTIASLDMVFIGADGRITRIVEDTVPYSLAVIDGGDARATIELEAGVTARLNIRVGDKVLSKSLGTA